MENEIWKDIPGWEGYYQASNFGRIKSLVRKGNRIERILTPERIHNGYLRVGLSRDNKLTGKLVHRLVWEAFNGPIPEGKEVNHIDEDKLNNRLENLNLMSRRENCLWGTGIERHKKSMFNGKMSKKVLQYDLDGNFIREWVSLSQITREKGYSIGNISSCCHGIRPTAHGYIWKYKREEVA